MISFTLRPLFSKKCSGTQMPCIIPRDLIPDLPLVSRCLNVGLTRLSERHVLRWAPACNGIFPSPCHTDYKTHINVSLLTQCSVYTPGITDGTGMAVSSQNYNLEFFRYRVRSLGCQTGPTREQGYQKTVDTLGISALNGIHVSSLDKVTFKWGAS
jgi:hypothetical protein